MRKISKRYIGIIALLLILITSGCGNKKSDVGSISDSFDGTVKVKVGNLEYECALNHTPEKINRIEIISPTEIAGLIFLWEDGKYNVLWKDLSCELNNQFLPPEAFAQAVVDVLDSLRGEEGLNYENSSSEGYTYTGKCESSDFKVKTGKDGTIKYISIPSKNIEVQFSENKR